MNALLGFLLSYILLYKYAAIFAFVFVTAVILPLPINTILLATGAFAGQGYFNFSIVYAVAVAANVLGDSFDYFLTKRYGRRLIRKMYERKFQTFARLEGYLRRHAGATIIVTRYVSSLDSIVNFLAGLVGIPYRTFFFYDLVGNGFEIFAVMFLGYAVGSYWENFSSLLNLLGWLFLVAILIAIVLGITWKRRAGRGGR